MSRSCTRDSHWRTRRNIFWIWIWWKRKKEELDSERNCASVIRSWILRPLWVCELLRDSYAVNQIKYSCTTSLVPEGEGMDAFIVLRWLYKRSKEKAWTMRLCCVFSIGGRIALFLLLPNTVLRCRRGRWHNFHFVSMLDTSPCEDQPWRSKSIDHFLVHYFCFVVIMSI